MKKLCEDKEKCDSITPGRKMFGDSECPGICPFRLLLIYMFLELFSFLSWALKENHGVTYVTEGLCKSINDGVNRGLV